MFAKRAGGAGELDSFKSFMVTSIYYTFKANAAENVDRLHVIE